MSNKALLDPFGNFFVTLCDKFHKLSFEKQAALAMMVFFGLVLMMNVSIISHRESDSTLKDVPTQIVEREDGVNEMVYEKKINGINQTITISGEGLSVVIEDGINGE